MTEENSFTIQVTYIWAVGRFCVSRGGDEVFLCAEPESGGLEFLQSRSNVLQRYSRTGQLLNTWQHKCQHADSKHLLHLSIGDTPYIAISCWKCRSIRLYSMTDSDPITAYRHSGEDEMAPYAMCHGAHNTIMVGNWREGSQEVLVYDVTSTQFTLKDRIPVHVDQAWHIHYMETAQHGGIVIVSTWGEDNIMSAHSLDSKALVWKIVNKEIDGKGFQPCGMCSDPDTGALYVADQFNKRLIVLEPNTGEVIQSIQMPGVGLIVNIAWCSVQPHLVIHHWINDMNLITYYDIK